ncbi:MAG: deoxyguanosinetriphosphate triphosphohydrolase [Acidobacteria bacterium CG_4_9_14_3_um_filter_49_7]|nr:MAG: deoxyguanosinetriphosphate triphosphohydrolase [Acidobacteria bacterium CG_4_9_14_3_um_filter_49_7]
MTIREETEIREREMLSPHACLASKSRGRHWPEAPCDIRTCFQRDRDRVLHCKSFRRLKHKTQVFLAPVGDHYRTRLTHTLEVSQIARTISRALRLNEDLTEAIALGHDLGHTPFGHAGEAVLNRLVEGGFRHFVQSVRVVNFLERKGEGLNLTKEVMEGIGKHSKGRSGDPSGESLGIRTMEARVVRVSDVAAYLNHDCDDAIRAGIIRNEDIPGSVAKAIGQTPRERINRLVRDLIQNSRSADGGEIRMSPEIAVAFQQYKDFMYDEIYFDKKVKKEFAKSEKIIEFLFDYLMKNAEAEIPPFYFQRNNKPDRVVADYISGMTDLYAINLFEEFFVPRRWFRL